MKKSYEQAVKELNAKYRGRDKSELSLARLKLELEYGKIDKKMYNALRKMR